MTLFPGFSPFSIQTQENPSVTIHGLKKSGDDSSSLPPLLLLHGFPQTLHIWHRIAPNLTNRFNVILMDLRGYGQSSKPADVSAYAKSAMARDCIAVMDQLGLGESFYVCAHDRGARVAHKLCVDYPTRVKKAIFLDICPTLAMFTKTNLDFAKAYWHWFFLLQDDPIPETFILSRPRQFTEFLMGGAKKANLPIFDPACLDLYAQSMADPDAVHGMCNDYRASATLDLDEAREDLKNNRLIQSPLRVLWGKAGFIEKYLDAVEEWKAVTAAGVPVEGYAVDSGHYIPEQLPESVLSAVTEFFV